MKNTKGIPENTEKGLQAIPADSLLLHGGWGLQVSPIFPAIVALDAHLFVSLNLIDKRAAVLTIKQKVYNLQPFETMVGNMLHCIQDDHMFL